MFTFFKTSADMDAAYRAKQAQSQDQVTPVLTAANDDKYHERYFGNDDAAEETTTA